MFFQYFHYRLLALLRVGDSVIASTKFCLALFLIYSYVSSLFGDTLYLVPAFCNFLQISFRNEKLVYKRGCKLFVLLIRRAQLIYFVCKFCKPAFVGELYLIKLLWLNVKRKLLFLVLPVSAASSSLKTVCGLSPVVLPDGFGLSATNEFTAVTNTSP